MLNMLQAHSPAAREWQLSWSRLEGSSRGSCDARAVLKELRVNPRDLKQWPAEFSSETTDASWPALETMPAVPPVLPVPWALAFSAAHVELTVMASSSVLLCEESLPRETLVVDLQDPQVKHLSVLA